MRPRVFPAEDSTSRVTGTSSTLCFNEAAGIPRGRRDGAGVASPEDGGFNEAAGIPRGRRAVVHVSGTGADPASMRPRVFPAEDS